MQHNIRKRWDVIFMSAAFAKSVFDKPGQKRRTVMTMLEFAMQALHQ